MKHLAENNTEKSNAGTNVGVEHVGGDMFVSVPKGDAIFMKVRFMSLFLKWKLSGNT